MFDKLLFNVTSCECERECERERHVCHRVSINADQIQTLTFKWRAFGKNGKDITYSFQTDLSEMKIEPILIPRLRKLFSFALNCLVRFLAYTLYSIK